MIIDGIEIAGDDQWAGRGCRLTASCEQRMLGAPAITAAVGVARMHSHQPNASHVAGRAPSSPTVGKTYCRSVLLLPQREARIDRGVGEAVLRIAQRVRKALVPAEWLQVLQGAGGVASTKITISARVGTFERPCRESASAVVHVQAHQSELRGAGGSMIIDKQRRPATPGGTASARATATVITAISEAVSGPHQHDQQAAERDQVAE